MEINPKRLKSGDIFWEKYNGKYIFARVVLDMKEAFKKNTLELSGIFNTFLTEGTYYVEVYKGIYDTPDLASNETLLNGFFSTRYLHNKYEGEGWQWYSNQKVEPMNIDFPETVGHLYGKIFFQKGEVRITTKFTDENYDKMKVGGMNSFGFTGLIISALAYQNRNDLLLDDIIPAPMDKWDIRFNRELHNTLYKAIGEDPDISYFDLALKHGYDIRRFFN